MHELIYIARNMCFSLWTLAYTVRVNNTVNEQVSFAKVIYHEVHVRLIQLTHFHTHVQKKEEYI